MAVSLSINIVQNSQSIENNTSNITVNVVCSWSGGSYNLSDISWGVPQANGQLNVEGEISYFNSYINKYRTTNGSEVIYSKNVTVTHNTEGKRNVECSASFNTYISDGIINAYASKVLTDIPRYATILSAPNFNDEENPTITYSNPAGTNVSSLQACISLDGTNADVSYRDISKTATSYTFSLSTTERDILRAATSSNSRTVKFYVRTTIGGTTDTTNLTRTLTIKNPNPTINPTIVDQNSTTVALTGNSSKLIKYYSNANVTFNAAAVKKATLTSKKVTCGNKSLTADGTITGVESNGFIFTATDSRGNTTTKTVTPSFVNYVKLTCSLGNDMPSTNGTMTVNASGNYFNGSFGSKSNSLKVYYRYKKQGGSYNSWTSMTIKLSGNTYLATASLSGLNYQTAYVFQTYAVDSLATVYSSEKTVKATPVFDWGKDDFKFNVPMSAPSATLTKATVTTAPSANTDVANKAYVDGKSLTLNAIYPVNSIYISYSHTSPASLFGGTWQRIENRFLWGIASSATIGSTSGEKTHTLTIAEMPSHNHALIRPQWYGVDGSGPSTIEIDSPNSIFGVTGSTTKTYRSLQETYESYPAPIIKTGSGSAHNNMPPYINVSIWRRTA